MNRAKAELGENVIILESEQITGDGFISGGQDMTRITAAADENYSPSGNEPSDFGSVLSQAGRRGATSISDHRSNGEAGLSHELTNLRRELERLNARLRNMNRNDIPAPYDVVMEQLMAVGITAEHAEALIRQAIIQLDGDTRITDSRVLKIISQAVVGAIDRKVTEIGTRSKRRQIIALVGATGVGKTTSAMKMALHPNILGQDKTAIITTDTYRPAASEPLKAYSRITGIPIVEVGNVQEMVDKLPSLKMYDSILLDTPGRSPFFPNYIQEIQDYFAVLRPTQVCLTLSMTADMDDLMLAAGIYMSLNPTGVVFTKLDETSRPGKVLSIMQELNIPAQYICGGQSIPNDIQLVSGRVLWEKIAETI